MIPRPFDYHAPRTLPDAIGLLARYGDEAKLLAGGHSLLPMMKLRFAQPGHLIDLGKIAELKGIREEAGTLRIGAMTTENELIWSKLLQDKCPLLVEGRAPNLRSAGALQGHDRRRHLARRPGQRPPGADARARCVVRAEAARSGERVVPADGFFLGTYATLLEPSEIMTEIRMPVPAPGTGWAYAKLKRKVGDFATAAAAVTLRMKGETVAGGRDRADQRRRHRR